MMHKEEIVADDLLGLAIEYASTKPFQDSIDTFIDNNVQAFYSIAECKLPGNGELSHEYHTIFMEYQQLLDDLFEKVAHEGRFSTKQLYNCFRDAGMEHKADRCVVALTMLNVSRFVCTVADGKFTALFEENENKWFVDKVLSWMDFQEFLYMMQSAASRRNRK